MTSITDPEMLQAEFKEFLNRANGHVAYLPACVIADTLHFVNTKANVGEIADLIAHAIQIMLRDNPHETQLEFVHKVGKSLVSAQTIQ